MTIGSQIGYGSYTSGEESNYGNTYKDNQDKFIRNFDGRGIAEYYYLSLNKCVNINNRMVKVKSAVIYCYSGSDKTNITSDKYTATIDWTDTNWLSSHTFYDFCGGTEITGDEVSESFTPDITNSQFGGVVDENHWIAEITLLNGKSFELALRDNYTY